MRERQVTAMRRMMDTVNAGDARGYARLYAQDARISMHGRPALEGRAAIEQHELELLRDYPGARLAFYALWQQGPAAVAHYAVDWEGPLGRSMGHEGLLFHRFHPSGLIAEERRYNDSFTPMAQLGALGDVPSRARPVLPAEMEVHVAQGSPSEAENVATVKASWAALDAQDERGFLAYLAEDAVQDEMILPHPFVGKASVRAWLGAWNGAIADARTEITTILAVGDFVLVESVLRGTLDGRLGPVSAASQPFAVHRAAIVRVQGGKLSRIAAFLDAKELAAAVGAWPPAAK